MEEGKQIKEDFLLLKNKIEKVEEDLNNQLLALKERELIWTKMDEIANNMKEKIGKKKITFNISGKIFMTTVNTLLNTKDTLFYKMLISGEVDLDSEIFFDREPKIFSIILEYLRHKNFDKKRYSTSKLNGIIRQEAEYFEVNDILYEIGMGPSEIQFVDFKFSSPYVSGGVTVGTNKIEDISDKSLLKGICANSPGWIVIELNDEWEIKGLEIGGYGGNTSYWSPDNGTSASIKVSTDNVNYTNVGTIPSGYGYAIKSVTFSPVRCKYIKFDYTSYLGIGYLSLEKA